MRTGQAIATHLYFPSHSTQKQSEIKSRPQPHLDTLSQHSPPGLPASSFRCGGTPRSRTCSMDSSRSCNRSPPIVIHWAIGFSRASRSSSSSCPPPPPPPPPPLPPELGAESFVTHASTRFPPISPLPPSRTLSDPKLMTANNRTR